MLVEDKGEAFFDRGHKAEKVLSLYEHLSDSDLGRCTVAEGQRKESQAIADCVCTLILNTLHYLQTHTNALTIEVSVYEGIQEGARRVF